MLKIRLRERFRRFRIRNSRNWATLLFSQVILCFLLLLLILFFTGISKNGEEDIRAYFSGAGDLGDLSAQLSDIFSPDSPPPFDSVSDRFSFSEATVDVFGASLVFETAVPPLRGKITSGFGARKDPFSPNITFHSGIDIGVPVGTTVVSVLPGTVRKTGYNSTSGYYVEVEHANGFRSLYCHLSKISVSESETVHSGTVLAKSGESGKTTGPHLHFRLSYQKTPVDPLLFLSFDYE